MIPAFLSVAVWVVLAMRLIIRAVWILVSMKSVSYDRVPDSEALLKLGRDMKVRLSRGRPFILKEGLSNAYYNPLVDRIVLGHSFFRKLSAHERLAVVAHELTHIRRYHFLIEVFTVLASFFVVALVWKTVLDIVFVVVWVAFILAVLPHVARKFEYDADAEAGRRAGIGTTVAMLKKSFPEEGWHLEAIMHPSINSRVGRLLRRSGKSGQLPEEVPSS